jgi:hypothetical protein
MIGLAHSNDFLNRTIALIYLDVCLCVSVGVGVCDGDPSEGLSADHARAFRIRPIQRLKEPIVFVGIPVRPSIYRDGFYVRGRIEASRRQHASQLIAHLTLEGFKLRAEQLPPPCSVLIFARQSGLARSSQQMKNARLVG